MAIEIERKFLEWAGEEVTGDRRYGNSRLARYPFVTWGDMQSVPKHDTSDFSVTYCRKGRTLVANDVVRKGR